MIPKLEDVKIQNRIIITVLIVIGVILFLAIVGFATGRWEVKSQTDIPPSSYDARILGLEWEAIDEAYRQQIAHLFQIWMKDDKDQPQRALVGARQAQRAYIAIAEALDRRAEELRRRGDTK